MHSPSTTDCPAVWLQVAIVFFTVVHFVHLPYIYGALDKLGALPITTLGNYL